MTLDDLGELANRLEREGYLVLPAVLSARQAAALAQEIDSYLRLSAVDGEAIRAEAGTIYAARNVLDFAPITQSIWRQPLLMSLLDRVFGASFGLVRGLFFDKPPGGSWTLPWHQDLTIAVKRHPAAKSDRYRKPTTKAGVPHVEAPLDVLDNMLIVRIHLDPMTAVNGPLKVIPGSHKLGKAPPTNLDEAETILCKSGDVLVIRPLVAHASGLADPECKVHRRILHLEFASARELDEGMQWHQFIAAQEHAPGISL